MKRSKFTEEQIVYAIRQAEAGTAVGDLCRQLGVSDATSYACVRNRNGLIRGRNLPDGSGATRLVLYLSRFVIAVDVAGTAITACAGIDIQLFR
jgi:hypothetical protein